MANGAREDIQALKRLQREAFEELVGVGERLDNLEASTSGSAEHLRRSVGQTTRIKGQLLSCSGAAVGEVGAAK